MTNSELREEIEIALKLAPKGMEYGSWEQLAYTLLVDIKGSI